MNIDQYLEKLSAEKADMLTIHQIMAMRLNLALQKQSLDRTDIKATCKTCP